jgi:hypothetical protein
MRAFFGLLASVALAALAGCASPDEGSPPPSESNITAHQGAITDAQEETILGRLDDHCADAQCEGDLDFVTKKLTCDFVKQECVLALTVGTQFLKPHNKKFQRKCTLTQIKSVDDLLDKPAPNGFQDVTGSLLGKMDKCYDDAGQGIPTK